jgi:hypothetical protein
MMKKIGIVAIFALLASFASADIALEIGFGQMFDNDGSTPISIGDLWAIYIDVDGDGASAFTDSSSNASDSFLMDADDVLVGYGAIDNTFGSLAGYVQTGAGNAITAFNASVSGKNYYLLFFQDVDGSSATQPGEGTYFGYWQAANQTPTADNNTQTSALFTASSTAQYQTVPEPATALLALIGGGIAYAVRRRGHKFVC